MNKIRLFLSSPGDVAAERDRVRSVVARLNRQWGDVYDIDMEIIDWRTHVAPCAGRPQEVINEQIGDYDIFLGMMWKRFGTPTGVADSGTEEEFNIAYQNWVEFQKPRILFYFSKAEYSPKDRAELKQWDRVLEFKEKLQKMALVWEDETTDKFAEDLYDHLVLILKERFKPKAGVAPKADFNSYLNYLKTETMHIDIRGLVTGEGKVHQFRIDELYMPLKTTARMADVSHKSRGKMEAEFESSREVLLEDALKFKHLTIKGEPGAGKTTFLRFLTFDLCRRWLGEASSAKSTALHWPEPLPLPIFIRVGHFSEFIRTEKLTVRADSPDCLLQFLEKQSQGNKWGLTAADFEQELKAGRAVLLIDGLDEAPDSAQRQQICALAENLFKSFPKCSVILTGRPLALVGKAVPLGFELVEILPLDEAAMNNFLDHWTGALYAGAAAKAQQYRQELHFALQARPEIKRMARTPVMLTALAVVHWNQHRLPEQRAELYESIITWLLHTRELKPGRLNADKCRKLLQKLALAMFLHPNGRQRQVGLAWAAGTIGDKFEATKDVTPTEQATTFLQAEMVDSGIIVERNDRLEFWHLSFQEYLAACEVAGLLEQEQRQILFDKKCLYRAEWRELVLLLGGVLYQQGLEKINHLLDEMIKRAPKATSKNLPQVAETVALLEGIVHDLSPFEFKPANADYAALVKSVMGIFDKDLFRKIPVSVRIAAADALGRVGDPRLVNDPMIEIPEGTFFMGAQETDRNQPHYDQDVWGPEEAPVHPVKLSRFFITKYPITVGQFRRFVEADGYQQEKYWQNGGFKQFDAPEKWEAQLNYLTRPVVYVSWYEADAYCVWFAEFKGDGHLYRLPTEAEWERAARGPDAAYRKYPWGNKEPDGETANFAESGVGHASPVGIFPKSCSPEGVIDLAGNVWEWCWDWYDESYYNECNRQRIVENPQGPATGSLRVARGGSWYSSAQYCRSADRDLGTPEYRSDFIGFRLVFVP